MGKPAMIAGLSAIALVAAANAAAAQSCGSEVERLAQQYNLSPGTPREGASEASPAPAGSSGSSTGTTAAERAAGGAGVIAPPDTGTTAAVQPPAAAADNASRAPSPPGAASGASELSSGDRSRMQSMLQQALAAERQGKFTECLDLLRKAASLAGVPGTK